MPAYTNPRPTGPESSRSGSESGSGSRISVSSSGAIRETQTFGEGEDQVTRERWAADSVEGVEEMHDRAFGTEGSRVEFRG